MFLDNVLLEHGGLGGRPIRFFYLTFRLWAWIETYLNWLLTFQRDHSSPPWNSPPGCWGWWRRWLWFGSKHLSLYWCGSLPPWPPWYPSWRWCCSCWWEESGNSNLSGKSCILWKLYFKLSLMNNPVPTYPWLLDEILSKVNKWQENMKTLPAPLWCSSG